MQYDFRFKEDLIPFFFERVRKIQFLFSFFRNLFQNLGACTEIEIVQIYLVTFGEYLFRMKLLSEEFVGFL